MTDVRVQRLAPGDHQEDAAEGEKGEQRPVDDETEATPRIHGSQHAGVLEDPVDAEEGEDREPHHHHRPEEVPQSGGPPVLDRKQPDEDRCGDDQDPWLHTGNCNIEPLHGREDRDGRSDHPVSVEEGGPEQAHADQHGPPGGLSGVPDDQRRQREDPTFTVVVGSKDECEVLDGDHQDQGPEYEGQHSEDAVLGHFQVGDGE